MPDDRNRGGFGMFPDKPMAECSECRMWSYLAAIEGICLACSMDRKLIAGGSNDG